MSIFPAELRSSLNGKAVEHAEAYFDVFIERLMKRLKTNGPASSASPPVASPDEAAPSLEDEKEPYIPKRYDLFLSHKRTEAQTFVAASGSICSRCRTPASSIRRMTVS
jgi:hypothetical protein